MTTVNERPLADEAKAADAQADSASIAQAAPAAQTVRRQRISPLNRRRWENFKANRRGFWALWIFLALFGASLFAEFLVNDRPILVQYQGEYYYPTFVDYPEEVFGGFLPVTDYRDPFVQEEIAANGWAVWPPIRYSYRSVNNDIPSPAPSPPRVSPGWRSPPRRSTGRARARRPRESTWASWRPTRPPGRSRRPPAPPARPISSW